MEERDETAKEKARAPIKERITQNSLSETVYPLISPKPTVVKVVSTKYIEAIYTVISLSSA
jgi:hypothetical protein